MLTVSWGGSSVVVSENPFAAIELCMNAGNAASSHSRKNNWGSDVLEIAKEFFPQHAEKFEQDLRNSQTQYTFDFDFDYSYLENNLPYNAKGLLVVTRHNALIEYLIEKDIITKEQAATCKDSVTADDVRNMWVIGVLPIHLVAECALYTNLALHTPNELRGVELTLEQVRQYAQPIAHYSACKVEL
jgi:putative CRISPR-associated protein (TIGR02620 family)